MARRLADIRQSAASAAGRRGTTRKVIAALGVVPGGGVKHERGGNDRGVV
jgi:hypothetical protein